MSIEKEAMMKRTQDNPDWVQAEIQDGSLGTILLFRHTTNCLKIVQNVAFEFFEFWHFPPIFVLFQLTCLVTLFDRKLKFFKNSPN